MIAGLGEAAKLVTCREAAAASAAFGRSTASLTPAFTLLMRLLPLLPPTGGERPLGCAASGWGCIRLCLGVKGGAGAVHNRQTPAAACRQDAVTRSEDV